MGVSAKPKEKSVVNTALFYLNALTTFVIVFYIFSVSSISIIIFIVKEVSDFSVSNFHSEEISKAK